MTIPWRPFDGWATGQRRHRVVDDALRTGHQRRQTGEVVERGRCLSAGLVDAGDVENESAVRLRVAGGDDHELGAPRHLPGPFHVEPGVGFDLRVVHLTSGLSMRLSPGLARNNGVRVGVSAMSRPG
jgi:hypothetical protein